MVTNLFLKRNKLAGLNPPRIGTSIAIALVLRCAVALAVKLVTGDFSTVYSYDTFDYLIPAQEWLQTGIYSNQGLPELFRPPGYPIFLIPGIFFGQIELITLSLQILISTSNVYLMYQIICALNYSENTASWGAFFLAIEPATILYTNKLLSETLYTFFLLLLILSLARYFTNRKLCLMLISALLLAGSIYIRPVGYFMPIMLFVVLLFIKRIYQREKPRELIPYTHLISFLLITQSLLGLWHARNFLQAGYTGFSTFEGVNLYFYHGASIDAAKRKIPLYDLQNEMGYRDQNIYFQLHPEQETWSKADINQYQIEQGIRTIINNLPRYAPIYLFGIARTLLDPSGNEFLRIFNAYKLKPGIIGAVIDQNLTDKVKLVLDLLISNPLVAGVNLFFGLVLITYYFFAWIGITQKSAWRNYCMIILICLGLYLILLSGGPVGVDRLRVPVMPIICVFSGIGISRLTLKDNHNTPGIQKPLLDIGEGPEPCER